MWSKWEEDRGFLCEDILNWAEKNCPAFYHRLHYHLLESAPLS